MKLARLDVTSLPGVSRGFGLRSLADDINLIVGPNAIGKSSLVRTLKLLLGQPNKHDPLVTLAAEFTEGEKRWRVQRTGQQIGWRCNGDAVARPNLPASNELARYCLSMEDLIKADATDEALARELQRELRGGFDLGKARTELGPRHGTGERKAFYESLSGVRNAESDADALRQVQVSIPSLALKIDAARGAAEQVRLIGSAKALLKARRASRAAEQRLQEFPSNMDKLTGRELEQIEKHRSDFENSEKQRLEQTQAMRLAQRSLEDSGLASSDFEQATRALSVVQSKLRTIEKLQTEAAHQRKTHVRQREKLDDATRQLGSDAPSSLDPENMRRAEGFAAAFLKLTERKTQLEQRIELSGGAPGERDIQNHKNVALALHKWLDAESQASHMRPSDLPLWASLILAVASTLGFIFLPPLMPALLALLLISALVWALVTFRLSAHQQGNARERDTIKQFEKAGISFPNAWSVPEVQEQLRELEDTLARFERASEAQKELSALEQKIQEKDAEKRALAKGMGFNPLLPLTALDRFIRLAKDYDESRLALQSASRELADTDEAINKTLAQARSLLLRWVPEVSEDADFDHLTAACEIFEDKLKDAQKATNELNNAEQLAEQQETASARAGNDIAAIYQRAGLCEDEHHLLIERIGQLESWKKARDGLIETEAQEKQCKAALQGESATLELVERDDESKLDRLLQEAQARASQLESLQDERAKAEARIEQAEQGRTLEDVIAEREQARDRLEQKRDELLTHKATELLLGRVEAAYRATHEPEVLRQAGALFQQVTANAFELRLSEDGTFQAWDTEQGALRSLEELSTGTRMQLLLSSRVAWVQSQSEAGKTLPLFLDEALTTSDEHRFITLAKSLDAISREAGIQIIYLSARRHEQDLWRSALGRDPHCIDLAEIRGQSGDLDWRAFDVKAPEPIPAPAGDAVEYAKRLGVPPVNPALDAGEIHLFHLLRDDLELLHQFMQTLRIASLGQLESYLRQRKTTRTDADLSYLMERCSAARAWASAWQQGRGRPIGALDLAASGAFSQRFLSQATQLATSKAISGDAPRMLRALRRGGLKGFQSKKTGEFEAWLRANEYLDDRAVLSQDERRHRTLQAYDLADGNRLEDIGRCIDWWEASVIE